ncbi:MAG: hypothetical protein ACU0CX_22770 [Sagittula sp.]
MIDDLTTRSVTEPYRMFTSRAEFRLSLRADNADQRLTPKAIDLGIVSEERARAFTQKMEALNASKRLLEETSFTPSQVKTLGIAVNQDGTRRSGFQLLSFKDVTLTQLSKLEPAFLGIDEATGAQIEKEALYANYLDRQARDVDTLRRDEAVRIPPDFDFNALPSLSNELRKKLDDVRPESIAQASRIEGMTPAALMLILAKLRQVERKTVA